MQKSYNAVYGQSNYDICLNVYGSLDNLMKLLQDSQVDNVNNNPASNQQFLYDDSLVADQGINQSFSLKGIRYATDIGQNGSVYYITQQTKPPGYKPPPRPIFNPPTTSSMYSQTSSTEYLSNADGTTIITLLDKDGNSMIGCDLVQVEKEIKPLGKSQWSWAKSTGILTLLSGTTVDNGQTLFVLYNKTITG